MKEKTDWRADNDFCHSAGLFQLMLTTVSGFAGNASRLHKGFAQQLCVYG